MKGLVDWQHQLRPPLWPHHHNWAEVKPPGPYLCPSYPSHGQFLLMPGHGVVLVLAHSYGMWDSTNGHLWLWTPHNPGRNFLRIAPLSDSFLPPSLFTDIRPVSRSESSFCLLLFPPCLSLTGIFPSKSLVHRILPWWLLLQRPNTEVVAVVQARDNTSLKEEIGRGD